MGPKSEALFIVGHVYYLFSFIIFISPHQKKGYLFIFLYAYYSKCFFIIISLSRTGRKLPCLKRQKPPNNKIRNTKIKSKQATRVNKMEIPKH